MTQTEEHLTGDGIQVQDVFPLRFVQQRAWCRTWQRFSWQPVVYWEQLRFAVCFADLHDETDSRSRCDFHFI